MWPFTKRATPQLNDGSIKLNDALLNALFNPDAMTLDKAMQIPAFAGCVNLICGTSKIVPIRLYQMVSKDDDERIEIVDGDPRVDLLNTDTGDTLTGANFKAAMFYDYLTSKGGYAYINHRGKNWKSLNYVDTSYVSFYETEDHIFKDYKILVDGKIYEGYRFLKFLRRTRDGYRGISVVDENKALLNAAYNTIILENTLVKRGGNKRGFLQAEHKLTQESINVLKEAFKNMYNNDSDSVPVLNEGLKFQEASSTSVELQLNENKKQDGAEICKLFCVPPAILAGGATDRDWTAFIQYCMVPYFEDFTNALNRDFLLESEKERFFFAADFSELTKGDIKSRYEAYKTAISSGFLQIDEVRRKENLPGLGLSFVKLGLQDIMYYPDKNGVYTPNTGKWGTISDQTQDEPNQDVEPPNQPAPQEQTEPTIPLNDEGNPSGQKGDKDADINSG